MGDLNIAASSKMRLLAGPLFVFVLGCLINYFDAFGHEKNCYLARPSNFLNKLFVKQGWAWFTLAFWISVFARSYEKRNVARSACRYMAATVWWALFSQWLLGPPIMDRLFTATGGTCVTQTPGTLVTTSRACRSSGGVWQGGHDPSGHVFLLTLSVVLIPMERFPVAFESNTTYRLISGLVADSIGLVNMFMLLSTCACFHSFGEKLSGLAFAMAEIVFVYFMGATHSWGRFFGTDNTGIPMSFSMVLQQQGTVTPNPISDVQVHDANTKNESGTVSAMK